MAKDYTASEVETAVRKVVRGTVRRPYGPLGNRELSVEFTDLQDAAAGVYATTPEAVFYTVFLGARRLLEATTTAAAQAAALLEAITAVGRYAAPVRSISYLANAQVALASLSSAADARTEAFQDLTSVPAYKRYVENTAKFLRAAAQSIRAEGEIVQTPQEARLQLMQLTEELLKQQQFLVERAQYLRGALTDFESLNLAGVLSAGVIESTRRTLQTRVEQLTALSEDARNQLLREVTLDVLAGRAAVEQFGALPQLTAFVPLEGAGGAYADEGHPGTPAALTSTLGGPYSLVPGQTQLLVQVDEGATLTLDLPASFLAELRGLVGDPYRIYGPSNPPGVGVARNDHFVLEVPGYPTIDVRLANGNTIKASLLADQLNAAVTTQPLEFLALHQSVKFAGQVDLVAVGANADLVGDWAAVDLTGSSNTVRISDRDSPNYPGYYEIVAATPTVLSLVLLEGPPPVSETAVQVELGLNTRVLQVGIKEAAAAQALADRQSFRFASAVSDPAFSTLGFPAGAELRCLPTPTSTVVKTLNTSTAAAAVTGAPLLRASTVLVVTQSLRGRTDPYDQLVLVVYRLRARATQPGGTTVVLPLTQVLDGGPAVVGDELVLREASVSADVGRRGTVVAVAAGSITAQFASSIAAGDVLFETCPVGALRVEDVVQLSTGPNKGDYEVSAVGPFAGDAFLTTPVPLPQALGGQPYVTAVTVGRWHLALQSLRTTTGSAVRVLPGGCAAEFFDSTPAAAYGSTPWVRLPAFPRSLSLGDLLELYVGSYNVPDFVATVTGLEASQRTVRVDPPLGMEQVALTFSNAVEPPFARVRNVQTNTFTLLQANLESWLSSPANQESFARGLTRVLNPLVVGANPTASDIGTARAQVQILLTLITTLSSLLGEYTADVVPGVDVLLEAFRQKGADRAVDLLLSGRFRAFFSVNQDTSSYLGAALAQLREVQRRDLPVQRTQREGARLLASYEEPDAEFDLSDAADAPEPDIPGMFTDVGEGTAY